MCKLTNTHSPVLFCVVTHLLSIERRRKSHHFLNPVVRMIPATSIRKLAVTDVTNATNAATQDLDKSQISSHIFYMYFAYPANNDPWFHMFCKWIHEFNCLNSRVSVGEFTGFCEQIWCVDTCLPWNHEVFTWWHVPVNPYQFWPSTTCVKLVQNSWQQAEHVYSREYIWKHILVERYQLWTSMTHAN